MMAHPARKLIVQLRRLESAWFTNTRWRGGRPELMRRTPRQYEPGHAHPLHVVFISGDPHDGTPARWCFTLPGKPFTPNQLLTAVASF